MSTTDAQNESDVSEAAPKQPLNLTVQVDAPQTCLRHVVVTVPRADVDRYMREAYDELVPAAQVPGFRSGRAPRKLVEKQFKDRVSEQVKGTLLMDCLTQVTEEQELSAISEPDFDFESVELPDTGDFKFEFKIEVRPEFDTPQWKGLALTDTGETVEDEQVDASIARVLKKYASLDAVEGAAELGDYLLLTATFRDGDKVLSEMDEERVELVSSLSFPDARCEGFGDLMVGVKEGESRTGKVLLSDNAAEGMAGKEVDAEFTVVEVSRYDLPALTKDILEELGDFDSEEDLREFVAESLQRQVDYRRQQAFRAQITDILTADANWELPPELVQRQTRRELERKVLELRRSGFPEDEIRSVINLNSQNAKSATEAALREHFILERIADDENIDAEPQDYDVEIGLIAEQSDMPERRVRARLEKNGQMDALRNQIIERKVIEMITAEAKLTVSSDKPSGAKQATEKKRDAAVGHSVLRTKASLPEAKYDDHDVASQDAQASKNPNA